MIWERIEPTAEQSWAWDSAGWCPFCGSATTADEDAYGLCYCRDCDSCSSYWRTDTAKEMDEGRPHRETCPECIAWAESPEGYAELERQRIERCKAVRP